MTDPIRAALDAAAEAMNPDGFRAYPTARRNDAARAIAAFHRSMARSTTDPACFSRLHAIADVVLAVAKDQAND
jgi:hypothetical protein